MKKEISSKIISDAEFNEAYANLDNIRLMNSILKGFRKRFRKCDFSNCKQLALWKTMRVHQPGRQKFTSSLYNYMKWECLGVVAKYMKERNAGILSVPNEYLDSKPVEINPEVEDVRSCILAMHKSRRRLIYLRYYKKMALAEIAKKYNVTHECIRQHIKSAVIELGCVYNEDDNLSEILSKRK